MEQNPISTDLQPPSPMTTFPQPTNAVPSPTISNHPPYAEMITAAIVGLKDKDGSSKQAISKYIEKEYHNLPPTHSVMLTHHLKRLKNQGQLVMVKHSYALPGYNNTLDFTNPTNNALEISNNNVSGSAKRKPGRPPKLRSVPGLGVQVAYDGSVQQAFPYNGQSPVQGVVDVSFGSEGNNNVVGGGSGTEPLFASLGLGDEGVAVEKESTGVVAKRRPGRPPKNGGSGVVGRIGNVGEVKGAASEVKEVVAGVGGNGEDGGVKRGRGRPARKGKMMKAVNGVRVARARGRPKRIGMGVVTVPLSGNVLKPRGRPKRVGRPVVNGGIVRPSRRPGRPAVTNVANMTGLQLAKPTKDGPGTAVLVTDPRQLVVYQELKSKYELLQSKVKQVAGVMKSCIDPNYGSTAVTALQELETLAGGDVNAASHGQTQEAIALPQN